MDVDFPLDMPRAHMIVNMSVLSAVLLHSISATARLREAARLSAILAAVSNGGDSSSPASQLSQLQERLQTLKTACKVTMNFATPYLVMLSHKFCLHHFISKGDLLALLYSLLPAAQLWMILSEREKQLFGRLKERCKAVLKIRSGAAVTPSEQVHCFTIPLDDVVVLDLEDLADTEK